MVRILNFGNGSRIRGSYHLRFSSNRGFLTGFRRYFHLRRRPIRRTFRSLDCFRPGNWVAHYFAVGLRGRPRARGPPARRRGRHRRQFDCLFDGQQSSLQVHARACADEDLITFDFCRAFRYRPDISLSISPRPTTWIAIAVPMRHASLQTHRKRVTAMSGAPTRGEKTAGGEVW